jgi:hypothetical protein
MIRRKFVKNISGLALAGLVPYRSPWKNETSIKDIIIGHGTHQYKVDMQWGQLDSNLYPVNDCHEMVQDSKGRIVLLTNHVKNNVIIYDKKGSLIEVWGTEFPGAHGLSLSVENGEDFLYISDNNRHEIIKTTINGKVVQIFPYPESSELYKSVDQYIPTETAIAENGDLYVADGYGLQYIHHYNSDGRLLNSFGGRGKEEYNFDNAHGICIDRRNGKETLLITARMQNKLKRFSLQGEWIETIHLPGAYICRPVIKKDHVYLATIWSGDGSADTGFISILDSKNKLISAPGANQPKYVNGDLQAMYQTLKIFKHPHDVCVDDNENLYVCQWNAGQSYPIKLIRV